MSTEKLCPPELSAMIAATARSSTNSRSRDQVLNPFELSCPPGQQKTMFKMKVVRNNKLPVNCQRSDEREERAKI